MRTIRHSASRKLATAALVLAVAVPLLAGPAASAGSPAPLADRVEFGAYHPPSPWEGMGPFAELEAQLGDDLGIVHQFIGWGSDWPLPDADVLDTAADSGRAFLLTWEPWDHAAGADQAAYRPDRIAAGDHDDYVREVAGILADVDADVYLRPMHEMNGDWYPWATGRPQVNPDDVVAAWHHLREVFADEGAEVSWVWSPNHEDVNAPPFEQAWPGADAVDVIGLDGYNWGGGPQGGWRSFEDLFADAYERAEALAPDTPVWITEVASAEAGGDKAAWIDDMFSSTAFPRLEAIVWFNEDKERDWRLSSSPQALAAAHSHLSAVGGGNDGDDDNGGPGGGRGRTVSRVAGPDRFATAAETAARVRDEHRDAGRDIGPAWVATGSDPADALSAGAAAAATNGTLLLTGSTLPPATRAAAGDTPIVVGGDKAVPGSVLKALGARRVAGRDRFATAAAVAGEHADADTVVLAGATAWADALAASSDGSPVLLTSSRELPQATRRALADLDPARVRVVGGTNAVAESVLREVRRQLPAAEVTRVAGADRFATAAALARHTHPDGADVVVAVTGSRYPDALAAAPLAAALDAPVLLTGSDTLPDATRRALDQLGAEEVIVVGGAAAVSDNVASALSRR